MKRIPYVAFLIIAGLLAVLGGSAISAQDRYTVKVPGGLAFSEFRGYEDGRLSPSVGRKRGCRDPR